MFLANVLKKVADSDNVSELAEDVPELCMEDVLELLHCSKYRGQSAPQNT
jgi:uncharacterized protein (DUF433 family)